MNKSLRTVLIVGLVFLCGVLAKMTVSEVERKLATHYVDSCFSAHKDPTPEQETACYSEAMSHLPYQVVPMLDFQPSLWKNTTGRCVETKGTKQYEYFECRWWNEIAL